jgi:energy-converting hydrogenase A subunit M
MVFCYSYEAYFLKSDIVSKLFEYCQTSLPDEESFKKIVRSKINNQSLYSRHKGILEKHQYDMQYKKKVFVSDLWNFLKEQNIIIDKDASHLNPETFIFYIEKLKALNAKDKAEYHDFALKCLKGYIENNPSWRKDIINPQALLGFDPKLDEYDKQCTVKNQQNTINSSEKIIGLMRDVIENGKSDEALSQIQKREIRRYILNDARYKTFTHGSSLSSISTLIKLF